MSPRKPPTKSTAQTRLDEIDELIDKYAQDLPDQNYLEFLSEMVDRAQTALDAREEELEGMKEEDDDSE